MVARNRAIVTAVIVLETGDHGPTFDDPSQRIQAPSQPITFVTRRAVYATDASSATRKLSYHCDRRSPKSRPCQ
jgi:hypothetical protein